MPINTTRWNRWRYNAYSLFYDRVLGVLQPGREQALKQAEPRPDDHILIVGGGSGLDLPVLQRMGAGEAHILLGDVSPAMLKRARRRVEQLGLPRVEIREMDAQALDVADASQSLVLLHLILAVVPDPHACIREAARVLAPGGRISIYDKFVPPGREPGLLWRLGNQISETLATSITRRLEPLLEEAGLEKVVDTPLRFNGFFRAVLVKKRD